ncbi:MAG: biotin synthase BioB [Planctomycetes bacterium]|nr:biotin synthase BioB [Planctomycetota bacterium]NUQ35361.1 biotin synthase BioB [Planctomycetaceae bacterium]
MIQPTNEFTVGHGPLINIAQAVIVGQALPERAALELLCLENDRVYDLMYAAFLVKRHFVGEELHRCSIVNAKSGGCGEDCGFCAQSASYETSAETYPLLGVDKILRAAEFAKSHGSTNFGIVTALRAVPKGKMLDQICDAVRELRKRGEILPDASLGTLGKEELQQLKEAGLEVYHHNLETARSYYPKVTTTRDWQDNLNTILWAGEIGLKTCCGGILGMGESIEQRVEFFTQLRDVNPNSVPVNFLVPIPGTPLENEGNITPLECLKAVAVLRLMLPGADIFVAGGRVQRLRQLQPMLFFAGANGMMVGNYLTTPGRTKKDDLELLADLDLISRAEHDQLMKPVPIMAGVPVS